MAADLINADFSQRVVIATNDLERLVASVGLPLVECRGGEEIFLLSGDLADEAGSYLEGTWIRNPPGYRRSLRSVNGATFWSKRGHLHY